jgi:sugar phosphate isomerase/epimerase
MGAAMRLGSHTGVDLTYCTNIHPGETWEETLASLVAHVPAIKAEVSPEEPFGIGLRLSAAAAETLARSETPAFRRFLSDNNLYVFTMNGFPFGNFHGTRVKEKVYLPDWRDEARLVYSNRLADILAELLPEGLEGSVSTVPGAYKAALRAPGDVERMVDNLVRHAAHLADIEARTGRVVRLALEPEPCCFLETVDETIRFFEDHLFSRRAADRMAKLTGRSERGALDLLRRHLGVCFDVCHAAVEFEADDALDRLAGAGIAVPKIQLSSALRLPQVNGQTERLLDPFDDGVYFHQVVERGANGLRRFSDLDGAFATLGERGEREWRVHFHIPVFLETIGDFSTTQTYLRTVLLRQLRAPVAAHLEVETYTWGVLPQAHRQDDLSSDIVRELQWVKRQLAA